MINYDADWYRSTLDAMHDMILVKDAESHLLWANKAFLNYYGMSQQDLFAMIDAEHSDPDDTLQYVRDDLTVVETGQPLNIPREAVTNSAGETHYFNTIKTPIFDQDQVTRTVGVCRMLDDGQITQTDTQHIDAKAFVSPMKALSDSFPNPMLLVDVRNRVVSVSPLWGDFFGMPELKAESFFHQAYPDLPGIKRAIARALHSYETVEQAIEYECPDGKQRSFMARISPWCYKDGRIGGATVVATDVTALHKQTAQLKAANDELVQFSYRASHDLKGPLSTAKGLAKFVRMDIDDNDLESARNNANRIVQMMEKLESTVLSFLSLATADGLNVQTENIHLEDLLGDICSGQRSLIASSGVQITTDLQVNDFISEPTRVRQIMENLISNGLKYCDPQKAERFVNVSSALTDQGALMISVQDNGTGIPADKFDEIFDLFSRFSAASEGTGLGLAIVKRHVNALGGQITAQDTGNGTCFTVTLPLHALKVAA